MKDYRRTRDSEDVDALLDKADELGEKINDFMDEISELQNKAMRLFFEIKDIIQEMQNILPSLPKNEYEYSQLKERLSDLEKIMSYLDDIYSSLYF